MSLVKPSSILVTQKSHQAKVPSKPATIETTQAVKGTRCKKSTDRCRRKPKVSNQKVLQHKGRPQRATATATAAMAQPDISCSEPSTPSFLARTVKATLVKDVDCQELFDKLYQNIVQEETSLSNLYSLQAQLQPNGAIFDQDDQEHFQEIVEQKESRVQAMRQKYETKCHLYQQLTEIKRNLDVLKEVSSKFDVGDNEPAKEFLIEKESILIDMHNETVESLLKE